MAYGFRFVPQQRTAAEPDNDRCPFCHARLRGKTLRISGVAEGVSPHFCKETTYGTYVSPTPAFPLAPEDWEAVTLPPDDAAGRLLQDIFAAPEPGPPFTHILKLPETEEEMAEPSGPSFTFREDET